MTEPTILGQSQSGRPGHNEGGEGGFEEAQLEGGGRLRRQLGGPHLLAVQPHPLPRHQLPARRWQAAHHAHRWTQSIPGKHSCEHSLVQIMNALVCGYSEGGSI